MILFVVPGVFGIETASVPSLGVAANKVAQVVPPFVEINISTLAQFTPFAVVPATAHVTDCDDPPAYETAVFGELTVKGPAVALTVTIISSLLFAGPPALLSLTVILKLSVLATEGKASTVNSGPAVVVAPVKTEDIFGKYLVDEVEELYDLKFTPEVFVALGAVELV
jgi:hypothetical protein